MLIRQPQRLIALSIVLLLLALPAGAMSIHSHPEGTSKTCTLCQALHLPGSLAGVPGLSLPVEAYEGVLPCEIIPISEAYTSSVDCRAPPPFAPAS